MPGCLTTPHTYLIIPAFPRLSASILPTSNNQHPSHTSIRSFQRRLNITSLSCMSTSKIIRKIFTKSTSTIMAWRSHGTTNEEMVDNLFKNRLITSSIVREAMKRVDRAHYCPSKADAYQDSPQAIGHRATISAPHMHASATESLLRFLTPNSTRTRPIRVLDIGSGSGYLTQVLAEVALGANSPLQPRPDPDQASQSGATSRQQPRVEVIGVEHIQALRNLGEANMARSQRGRELLETGAVRFVLGDGRLGWKEPAAGAAAAAPTAAGSENDNNDDGGYDAIHVGAGARTIHPELVAQLRRPGRLFIPVDDDEDGGGGRDQHIWVVDKGVDGVVVKERTLWVRYVPLTDAPVE